jgi:hypothetical protein
VIISPLRLSREKITPLGRIGGMKYTMSKKELARLTLIQGKGQNKEVIK